MKSPRNKDRFCPVKHLSCHLQVSPCDLYDWLGAALGGGAPHLCVLWKGASKFHPLSSLSPNFYAFTGEGESLLYRFYVHHNKMRRLAV